MRRLEFDQATLPRRGGAPPEPLHAELRQKSILNFDRLQSTIELVG
jgi:hypothetical protein